MVSEVINKGRDHMIVDLSVFYMQKMGWKVTTIYSLATPPEIIDFITPYDQPIKHHKYIEREFNDKYDSMMQLNCAVQ